ncbi:MAG: Uma2 family endonuclease [Chloroflexi bacterium]|nr:Uma2 family endonuclease [Chloroflexota bacterium]
MATTLRWTVADLEALPEPLDDKRYEIIDGELYVSTQPSYQHQLVCTRVTLALSQWSDQTGEGEAVFAPGVVFAVEEAVAPDVVWTRKERLPLVLGDDGKFHLAPDLVVEVLSPGPSNEQRDREIKLRLYSRRGVQEYWLVDWRQRLVEVYRRGAGDTLERVAIRTVRDALESPLLPGFSYPVARLFAGLP